METWILNFSNAIGWSIIHSLWQGASIYIILLGIFLVLPNLKSATKYNLAYIAQSLLFICFLYSIYHYISYLPIQKHTDFNISRQEELALYILYLKSKSWSITQLFPYIVTLYTIGIVIQSILCLKSLSLLNRIKKTGSDLVPGQWQSMLHKTVLSTNTEIKIKLLVSEYITTPITIGFVKPLIIFPTAYINNITKEEAEAILLHELAHIKKFDYLFNMWLIAMETLLFFNPFVWLMSKHIKIEREQKCDDFANLHLQRPFFYAKTLLKVELMRKEKASSFALAATGQQKYNLLDRIKRINNINMETKYTSIKHQLGAILFVTMALVSVAWINPQNGLKVETDKTNKSIQIHKDIVSFKKTPASAITNNDQQQSIKQIDNNISQLDTSKIVVQTQILQDKEIKAILQNIDIEGKKIQEYFESKEWKNQIADIERNAAAIEKQFNSTEWKEKIAAIEKSALQTEAYFNSPEWNDKIAKIEENAKKIEEKYNSPEWKEKIHQLNDLYNSEEYKDIQLKYDQELKKLKEKKK